MNGKFRKTGFDDERFADLTPGQRLAAAREAQGQSIEDVVRHTKLSRRQVMALESDAHDQLPGPVFVRGFMRNYARHLQLDPAPLLAALDAKSAPAVVPSAGVVAQADLRPGAEDSIRNPITEPVIEQGRAEQATVRQDSEPATRTLSDAAPADAASEPAWTAQDAPAFEPGSDRQPEYASIHESTLVAAPELAAADETRPKAIGESVDTLDGIADTRAAWRNYALVSLAVVIGLLALVIVTQT